MAKRGRPALGEAAARHEAIVSAALAELVERGYEKTTMLGVARRAGASKETLYARFGNRAGLFAALIAGQGAATIAHLERVLDDDADPRTTLGTFSKGLLTLLLTEPSVSLNRTAMASPELAGLLLRHGRHAIGPIVERHLAALTVRGALEVDDPAAAFELLYGLVVQDLQIRVLLGEKAPSARRIAQRADAAVERFLRLVGDGAGTGG